MFALLLLVSIVYDNFSKILNIISLSIRNRQIEQTQIRLLLKKQSDQGHPCLLFWQASCLFVCLFCCFTSQVNSYGHCWKVSSPNHTFSWAGLNKWLTSNSCTYFGLFLNESAEGRRMTVEIISWSISTKVWDRAGIELATPGSAVRYTSVARNVTDCATRPGNCEFQSWKLTIYLRTDIEMNRNFRTFTVFDMSCVLSSWCHGLLCGLWL